MEQKEFFPITSVSRADLEERGFDVSGVSDAVMERLAQRMADDYLEQMYWLSLDEMAEFVGIPRQQKQCDL